MIGKDNVFHCQIIAVYNKNCHACCCLINELGYVLYLLYICVLNMNINKVM